MDYQVNDWPMTDDVILTCKNAHKAYTESLKENKQKIEEQTKSVEKQHYFEDLKKSVAEQNDLYENIKKTNETLTTIYESEDKALGSVQRLLESGGKSDILLAKELLSTVKSLRKKEKEELNSVVLQSKQLAKKKPVTIDNFFEPKSVKK